MRQSPTLIVLHGGPVLDHSSFKPRDNTRPPQDPLAKARSIAVEEIVAALPPRRERFERLAGAGHGPWRDRPDEALAVIRASVRAHEPDAVGPTGSAC